MGNWLNIGPITIRIGSKHLANWGYPRLRVGGLSLWTRSNDGHLHLAGYHPRDSLTWHWFVALRPTRGARTGFYDLQWRKGFGERGLCLFGWSLCLNRQSYHKRSACDAA